MYPLLGLFPQVTGSFAQGKGKITDTAGFLVIATHCTRLILDEGDAVTSVFVGIQITVMTVYFRCRSVQGFSNLLQPDQFIIEVIENDPPFFTGFNQIPESIQLVLVVLPPQLSCTQQLGQLVVTNQFHPGGDILSVKIGFIMKFLKVQCVQHQITVLHEFPVFLCSRNEDLLFHLVRQLDNFFCFHEDAAMLCKFPLQVIHVLVSGDHLTLEGSIFHPGGLHIRPPESSLCDVPAQQLAL